MPFIGNADLDRPITFDSGLLYASYGGGPFRLAPSRCRVAPRPDGLVALQLDITRGLDRSTAMLSCDLTADYASEAALARARAINDAASLSACVLTNWWFRVLPSAVVGAPIELTAPTVLASNGLGAARIAAIIPVDTALVLESMLTGRTPLDGVAEAQFDGVSPRLPVVVRLELRALLDDLLTRADSTGALPRQAIVEYFNLDPSLLPLVVDGHVDSGSRRRFAEAMADRIVANYGRYVPSQMISDAPVVAIESPAGSSTLTWSLSQPFMATRRIVMPVDLLGDAQAQVARLGAGSIVRRFTSASLPSFGYERVTAFCNLPASRSGVDALGVTLKFPPHLPFRPQTLTATAVFGDDDKATMDVRLSPGEPLRYKYSTFAVLTDEKGTRQIDGPEVDGAGPTLLLSTDQFPIEFAVIEVTRALAELAVVSGACIYEADEAIHEQKIIFDSGNLSTAVAIPRDRTSFSIEGYAVARTGSGSLKFGPIETPQATIDVTSFADYGPQRADIKCIFDDTATLQALSLLPMDREETADNITALSLTPAQPVKTFEWSSRSPFAPGFRYRPFNAPQGAWSEFRSGSTLVLYSSQMRRQERARVRRLESTTAGPAAPESAVDPAGVSPAADVTDLLLFDNVSDATKKLYIPRYTLDMQTVSGQDRYRISMAQRGPASTLEVNLVATPDESLGDAARTASPYPHRVVATLDFLVSATSGARKLLPFTEITRTDNLVKASLTFATMAERDDVYRALTEPARDARLIVQRHLDVRAPERPPTGPTLGILTGPLLMALPIRPIMTMRPIALPQPPEPVATPVVTMMTVAPALALAGGAMRPRTESAAVVARDAGPVRMTRASRIPSDVVLHPKGRFVDALPTPTLAFTGTSEANGTTRCTLSVTNWKEFSDDFFAPSSDLPPCGLNKSSSRTWVDIVDADTSKRLYGYCALGSAKELNELSFAVAKDATVPARVSITLSDRRTKVARTSNVVETTKPAPSAPAMRDLRLQLDQAVAPSPFAFLPALHGYMFQGITPGTGSNQFIRYRFSWKGKFHTYLQDASRPESVYVFPDQFKIARRPDAPCSPFATVRVSSRPDGSNTDVVFDYVVAPYTDPKRLEAAQVQLLADPRFGASRVAFQPFLTSDVRFFLDRPALTGSVVEQRPDAAVVLQGWLKDTLTMTIGDFRLLFDAMHKRTASLFLGRVEIDVPETPNPVTETVPFSARFDDLSGEMLSYETTTVDDGAIAVTARNEIESPLSVQALDAFVSWSGQRCRGLVQGAALPTASLAPAATIQLTVTPEAPMPATAIPEVEFIPSGVTAVADPEAIWDSILDRTTVEYFRVVTVQAVATLFDPVAGREAERIVSILLEFENGGTGELEQTSLQTAVRIDYPIDDVVLGGTPPTSYRYTVTVIRADGRQDVDAAPRVGTASTFFVSVVR